ICRFVFTAPRTLQPGQPLNVNISAKDAAENVTHAVATLALGVAPTISQVAPLEGPASGGTEIVITGKSFIPGTQLLVDGVDATVAPQPSDDVSTTLRGRTPPHESGVVVVKVRMGGL